MLTTALGFITCFFCQQSLLFFITIIRRPFHHTLTTLNNEFAQLIKHFFNIKSAFSRNLQEGHAKSISTGLALLRRDHPLVHVVNLVAHNYDAHVVWSLGPHVIHPFGNDIEWFAIGNVVKNKCAVCAAVVDVCEWPIPLLAGCVPNLIF